VSVWVPCIEYDCGSLCVRACVCCGCDCVVPGCVNVCVFDVGVPVYVSLCVYAFVC